MLSIGNKKYRNLQEQVAYNTECIKKLDDYLDGITIEDKLVIIETDSGTFSDEELVILSGPLAFISNNSRVWMKDSETLTELVFKAIDIAATEVGGAYFNIGGSKIVVNRETGAYNTSSDTIITTYSKTQLDSIVANIMSVKANLSGADFTGPVTALTLAQSVANYTLNFSLTGAGPVTNPLTYKQIYNRFQVINGRLSVVFNFSVKNETGNPITLYSGSIHFEAGVDLSPNVASKIFDINGISVAEIASPAYTFICGACLSCLKNGVGYSATQIDALYASAFNRATPNRLSVMIGSNSNVTLTDQDILYISGRVLLDLI